MIPDRIFLGHTTTVVPVTVIRPNDAAPYAAGDVFGTLVSDSFDFSGIARSNGGSGMLMLALLIDSANQPVAPTVELWIFTAPPAAQVDNVAFAPTDLELANLVGVATFFASRIGNPAAAAAGNMIIQSDILSMPFKCAPGTTHLYGVAVVRNAYTPVQNESWTFNLTALQDY